MTYLEFCEAVAVAAVADKRTENKINQLWTGPKEGALALTKTIKEVQLLAKIWIRETFEVYSSNFGMVLQQWGLENRTRKTERHPNSYEPFFVPFSNDPVLEWSDHRCL